MKNKGINIFLLLIYIVAFAFVLFTGLSLFDDFLKFTSKISPYFVAKDETQKLLETKNKQEISFTKVDFNFDAKSASQVFLCADFTAWNKKPLLLEEVKEGHFSKTLFLPKGEYKYYFLVDGQPQKDEQAPSVSLDLKDCPLPEISLKNVL